MFPPEPARKTPLMTITDNGWFDQVRLLFIGSIRRSVFYQTEELNSAIK